MAASYKRLSEDLTAEHPLEEMLTESARDIDLSLERVEQIEPPYVPMFDEAFAWFHKVRGGIATQNLFLSCAVRALSPTMSMRALRLVSRLHPRMRIRRRLMNAIARLAEFQGLAKIPSAQIPWVSGRSPDFVREFIWALRSSTDHLLIRGAPRTKNPVQRRLLRGYSPLTRPIRIARPFAVRYGQRSVQPGIY